MSLQGASRLKPTRFGAWSGTKSISVVSSYKLQCIGIVVYPIFEHTHPYCRNEKVIVFFFVRRSKYKYFALGCQISREHCRCHHGHAPWLDFHIRPISFHHSKAFDGPPLLLARSHFPTWCKLQVIFWGTQCLCLWFLWVYPSIPSFSIQFLFLVRIIVWPKPMTKTVYWRLYVLTLHMEFCHCG